MVISVLFSPKALRENIAVFKRFFSRNSVPWSGAPANPRLKTYTAESGYVFHYFYQGHRPSRVAAGTEFAFQISLDRRDWQRLVIYLPNTALLAWQQAHARELSSNERYALVKMKLFEFFERHSPPARLPDLVLVDAADVTGLLEKLDVE
jgi:hypothetical protein